MAFTVVAGTTLVDDGVLPMLPTASTQALKSAAALSVLFSLMPTLAAAQQDEQVITEPDGRRYRITTRTVHRQVPVTEMRDQVQTFYRQQTTTQNLTSQQTYCVPTTQYQMVSRLNGRWNPFVTPYWTHEMQPVTTWRNQIATVQIPVTRTAWVPETRTTQVPVTTYRPAEEKIETKVALSDAPANRSYANSGAGNSGPSATLAALPNGPAPKAVAPTAVTPTPIGGTALQSDPPRQATGWRSSSTRPY